MLDEMAFKYIKFHITLIHNISSVVPTQQKRKIVRENVMQIAHMLFDNYKLFAALDKRE